MVHIFTFYVERAIWNAGQQGLTTLEGLFKGKDVQFTLNNAKKKHV
jgi:hypothetical protein